MSLILGGEILGRTKSGICGKKQIKPTKRERKRDPKVVTFRRWFLEMTFNSSELIKTLCAVYALTTKHYWKIYLQNFNQIKTHIQNKFTIKFSKIAQIKSIKSRACIKKVLISKYFI